jgi:hypothetical protein
MTWGRGEGDDAAATRSCGCVTIGKRRAVEQGTPDHTTHTSKRKVVYPDPEEEPIGDVSRHTSTPDAQSGATSSPTSRLLPRAGRPTRRVKAEPTHQSAHQ